MIDWLIKWLSRWSHTKPPVVCDHLFTIYAINPYRSRCTFCREEHPDSGNLG